MDRDIVVYLASLVLIIGTVFGVGIVRGGVQEETQVTIDVGYVPPTIEIIEPGTCEGIGGLENVEIETEVTAPGQDSAVEQVDIWMEYIGDGDPGDADVYAMKEDVPIVEWDEDLGTVETVIFEPDTMWRFGYWEIGATVYGEDDYYHTHMIWTIAEWYCEIVSAEDGSAVGIPGDTLEGDDFENYEGEIPQIKITSNAYWNLTFDDSYVLEGPDGSTHIEGENTKGGYEGQTENLIEMPPAFEKSYDIHYWVNIPIGQMSGNYSTEEYPAVHTLSKAEEAVDCPPFGKESAFGGDSPVNVGEPGAWWYYFDTTGEETQDIWAGQFFKAGEVTVTEAVDGERTITIELSQGWKLQDDDEPVKIQGYHELPDDPRPFGQFTTYKGDSTEVTVDEYPFYVIHLDVEGHTGD